MKSISLKSSLKCWVSSLTLAGFVFLTGCSQSSFSDDPAQLYQNKSAEQIYLQGKQELANRSYADAVKAFEALQSLYPFGGYAQKAQRDLIYAYFKSGQFALAVTAADQYLRVYPRSEHVDYAYYMKGLANLYSGSTWVQRALPIDMSERDFAAAKRAYANFRTLIQLFPKSQYAADAKQRMVALRNRFARHELNVARYYYKRQAYVAAANRATQLIKNYERTPQVKDALRILIKANTAMGLTESANEARKVFATNYPGERV